MQAAHDAVAVGRSSGPECAVHRCGGLPSLQKVSANHVSLCCQVCEKYDDMIGRTLPVFCPSGCVPPPSREAQVNIFVLSTFREAPQRVGQVRSNVSQLHPAALKPDASPLLQVL